MWCLDYRILVRNLTDVHECSCTNELEWAQTDSGGAQLIIGFTVAFAGAPAWQHMQ